jgi:hypothetical protein
MRVLLSISSAHSRRREKQKRVLPTRSLNTERCIYDYGISSIVKPASKTSILIESHEYLRNRRGGHGAEIIKSLRVRTR